MSSDTKNVKLGICRVIYDGNDLGYTKGGVEVEVQTETQKIEVDQFGKTPISEVIMSRMVTAKIPLAETTLDNLVATMPGASLVTNGGTKASGTVTFATSPPAANDKVTIAGFDFIFKASPDATKPNEMAVPASFTAAATALAAAVNATLDSPVQAAAAAGVVTLTADAFGVAGNAITLAKSGANITVSGAVLSGGVDVQKQKVTVPTGIGIDLLSISKKLVLHPKNKADGDKSDDFVIPRAGTPGALTFAYKIDEQRVYNISFNGYPDPATGVLFVVGDETAS